MNKKVTFVKLSKFDDEIKSEIKRRKIAFSFGIFHPSQITECERRIIYRANGEKTTNEYDLISFVKKETQEAIKNKWIKFFKESIQIKLLYENVLATDCNYNLNGTVDSILERGDTKIVFMAKLLSEEDFKHAREYSPLRKHIIEIMLYMWMLEISNSLLLYENLNSGEICIFNIMPFNPIIEASRKKCMKMLENKIIGKLPQRPYENSLEKECMECEYKDKCWNKEKL